MHSPRIRPATLADVPAILAFIRALATYERLLHEVEATEEKLRATLFPTDGRPAAECILALTDAGKPVGFALFFTNYSTFLATPGLYLEDLFVEPEYRGSGYGKALLVHLARLANQRGYGRMEWAVLTWNQPAIEFYESLGAKRLHDWTVCRLTGSDLARYAQLFEQLEGKKPEADLILFTLAERLQSWKRSRMNTPNSALDELVDVLGEDDTRMLIRTYLEQTENKLKQLPSITAAAQRMTVHSVRGSSSQVGATAFATFCASMEARLDRIPNALNAGELAEIDRMFQQDIAPLISWLKTEPK